MDTKVQVKSITSTNQAVLVTLGSLGAFFIGVAMIVAPLRYIIAEEPIELIKPMMVKNVNQAELLASDDTFGFFYVKAYMGKTTAPITLGTVHYGHYFEDGQSVSQIKPLIVYTERAHYSTLLTLDTTEGVKTICIPDTSKDATDEDDMFNTERKYTYYIDVYGDSYLNPELTQKTATNCQTTLAKSLHPYPILGGEVYSGAPYYMYIMRDSYAQLGVQDTTVTVTDQFPVSIEESLTPIEVYFMTPSTDNQPETPFSQSKGVMSINWQNPDIGGYPYVGVNLCLPELTIDPVARLFYDKYGFPYEDVMLTQRVTCTFPVPTCMDTDGTDQFTKGTVSGMDYVGRSYSENDFCVDSHVMERSCYQTNSGSYSTSDLVYCANGCSDGRCVQAPACDSCDSKYPPACCGGQEINEVL